MDSFKKAHEFTALWEGGISEDKDDPGGLTMYGVATHFMKDFAATAKGRALCGQLGIPLPICRASMLKITRDKAAQILKAAFFDGLEGLPLPLAIATYDGAVNCGKSRGHKFTQQAANKINKAGLAIDGIIGPKSLAACQTNPMAIAREAIDRREDYYYDVVTAKPKMRKFLKGWLNRVQALRLYISELA